MSPRNITIAARYALRVTTIAGACLICGVAAGQADALVEIDVRVAPIKATLPADVEAPAALDSDALAAMLGPEATGMTEEVIVRGQTPGALRIQIELAEDAVYDRFNEINSNDEFDIHCEEIAFTGTRMLTRVCQPNFWHAAEEDIALETVRSLQGSAFAAGTGQFRGEAHYKRLLMRDEMERLAREDEEFLEALRHLYSLTLGDDPN